MSSDSEDLIELGHRVYNEQERAAIDVFKTTYMESTSPAGRRAIAQLNIFPALFNHWKSSGKVYNKKETRMKSDVCLHIFIIDY